MTTQFQYQPLKWPPNMGLAQLHLNCCRPGVEDPQGNLCPCCDRVEKVKNKTWFQRDIIKDFKNYGGGIPAYFNLVKYCIIVFLILIVVKVIYHIYLLETVCPNLQNTTNKCSVAYGIIKLCQIQTIYNYLENNNQQTKAQILNYVQMAAYIILVIGTIFIKIYLQSINQNQIANDEKLFSKFALIIKGVPTYYSIEDIKKEISEMDASIEICQAFYVQKICQYDKSYRNIFDLYFKIKNLENSIIENPDQKKEAQLQKTYENYVKLHQAVEQNKQFFDKTSKKMVMVFNTSEAKELVYQELKVNECSKFCYYVTKICGKQGRINYYAQKISEPQQINWNNIGESSTFKTKVRIQTTLIGVGFMIVSFLILYFPMVKIDEIKLQDPGVGTALGFIISTFILILAYIFRLIIVGLIPKRRASSKLSQAYFVIMTTIIFHFLYYAVTPCTFFVLATNIPPNAKLRQLFSAVTIFVIFTVIIALVDLKYRVYNGKKKKLLFQQSIANNYCQQRLHQELMPPTFPIEFKVMVVFNIWTFNSFYVFQIPYLLVLFVLILFIIYWIDKRNLYKHYKMQTYLSLELQIKVQKMYIIFFLISVAVGYGLTTIYNWEIYIIIGVTIVALIVNFTLNYNYKIKKQSVQPKKETIKQYLVQTQQNQAATQHLNMLQKQLKLSFIGGNFPQFSSESLATASFTYGYSEVYNRYKAQFKNREINDMLEEKYRLVKAELIKSDHKRRQSQMPPLQPGSLEQRLVKQEVVQEVKQNTKSEQKKQNQDTLVNFYKPLDVQQTNQEEKVIEGEEEKANRENSESVSQNQQDK